MKKAQILGCNYVKGKATLFICYFWDGSEFRAFWYDKSYKTLAGAKRALMKLGYDEIIVECDDEVNEK